MNKLFASSVNPEKLSLTLKGAVPLVVILLALSGFNSSELALNQVVDSGVNIIGMIAALITGVIALIGAVRKFWVLIQGAITR